MVELLADHPWLLGVLVAAGYVGSLVLHPYTKCDRCDGTGRHFGAVFSWGQRACHRCSGTGRKQRLGAFLIGRGTPRRSMSRVAPHTKRGSGGSSS